MPLERVAPVLEEALGPALPGVVPELSEGLFEQVGRVDPLVRGEQELERSAALQSQILAVRKQGVFLPLDETAVLPGQSRILALAHAVQGFTQVA